MNSRINPPLTALAPRLDIDPEHSRQLRKIVHNRVVLGIRLRIGRSLFTSFIGAPDEGRLETHSLGRVEVKVVASDHATLLRFELQITGSTCIGFW